MHNYHVLEKEKEIECPSATIRTLLKSLVLAKSSGRLKTKTKHLEHLYVMAKIVICQYVHLLRLTGGHVILSSPSSTLAKEQAFWVGGESFYTTLSEGSSYLRILLFSSMDSPNGKITS